MSAQPIPQHLNRVIEALSYLQSNAPEGRVLQFPALPQQSHTQPRTIEGIFGISEAQSERVETMVGRMLNTGAFKARGFDRENVESFGNLALYAIHRKCSRGVRVTASGAVLRRILRDCSGWSLEPKTFKRSLDAYLADMELEVSERTGRRISGQTINNFVAQLRSIWEVAVSIDLIDHNPMPPARYEKKRTKPRKRTLSEAEISGMRSALWHQHRGLYHAYLFCLKNPIGYGDVRRLRCSDVDLESMMITYHRQKTGAAACPIIYPELQEYVRDRVQAGHTLLFSIPHDHRWAWKHAKQAANVSNLKWHDLRHHAATWLVRQGTPLHIVASLGGWSTQDMVERYHDLKAESAAEYARKTLLRTEG